MDLGLTVTGDRQVALKFEQFPQQARARLLAALGRVGAELYAMVEGREPERTGRLHSTTVLRIIDKPERVGVVVSVTADFGKAAALEYGAHRPTQVKAHYARLDHAFSRAIEPEQVLVEAHSRQVNILEHRFLRGSLGEIEAGALEAMEEALVEAASE